MANKRCSRCRGTKPEESFRNRAGQPRETCADCRKKDVENRREARRLAKQRRATEGDQPAPPPMSSGVNTFSLADPFGPPPIPSPPPQSRRSRRPNQNGANMILQPPGPGHPHHNVPPYMAPPPGHMLIAHQVPMPMPMSMPLLTSMPAPMPTPMPTPMLAPGSMPVPGTYHHHPQAIAPHQKTATEDPYPQQLHQQSRSSAHHSASPPETSFSTQSTQPLHHHHPPSPPQPPSQPQPNPLRVTPPVHEQPVRNPLKQWQHNSPATDDLIATAAHQPTSWGTLFARAPDNTAETDMISAAVAQAIGRGKGRDAGGGGAGVDEIVTASVRRAMAKKKSAGRGRQLTAASSPASSMSEPSHAAYGLLGHS